MSTYRKPWNNEDLRAWMIQHDFPGYEDCGHFTTVIYNGAFATFTFIKKKEGTPGSEEDRPSYAVVSSIRKHFMNRVGGYEIITFYHFVRKCFISFITKLVIQFFL